LNPKIKIIELRSKIEGNVALLIPSLNEGQRLVSQIQSLEKEIGRDLDLIIVDGASTDGSIEKIISLNPTILRYVMTSHAKRGLSFDLFASLKMISNQYEYILTLDGNGKDDVTKLMSMIRYAKDNKFDFVQGSRFLKNGTSDNLPLERYFGIKLFISPIVSIFSRTLFTDPSNQCRIFSQKAANLVTSVDSTKFERYDFFFFIPIKISRSGLKVSEFPVRRSYPKEGPIPTHIRRSHYAKLAIDLIKVGFRWRKY
jgi:glycosyltransferase involved in cell wall biosynthesis